MKLMTKAIEKALPKMHSTNERRAVCKFFDPCGRYTLYVVEGEKLPDGDFEFYGYVVSPLGPDCDEWGYTRLSELQGVKNKFGLGIERDLHFQPAPVDSLIRR